MHTILIADEDSLYVTTINRVAERSTEKIKVIGQVTNGKDAIQRTKELKPDILFIDVKLSGMNGIEVVKEIRKLNINTHVIILTAYDYFDFVKECIDLKVDAYLLKPIKNDVLFNALSKVIQDIKDEKKKINIANKLNKDLEETHKFIEYSFIFSLLFSGDYKSELSSYEEQLGLDSEGYIINIEITPKLNEQEGSNDAIYKCIKETITPLYVCVVGPKMMDRIIVFICDEKDNEHVKQKNNIKLLCNQIIKNIKELLDTTVLIGVGSIARIEQLHVSYEESLKCLRYKREDATKAIHIYDVEEKMAIVHDSYIEMERLMLGSVKTGKVDAMDYFTSLLDMLRTLNSEDRKNKILELLILTCRYARLEGPNEGAFLNYIGYAEELKNIVDSGLDGWAYLKFQYLIKTIRIRKTARVPYVIHNAILYIEKHYMEAISLDEIANHVALTPQYLSSYFKDEMDCNLVEYITKLRIEKAKEIIRNSQMTVQEICFIVGYHDPNYFSRIFKKHVGCTPSNYKKKYEEI